MTREDQQTQNDLDRLAALRDEAAKAGDFDSAVEFERFRGEAMGFYKERIEFISTRPQTTRERIIAYLAATRNRARREESL